MPGKAQLRCAGSNSIRRLLNEYSNENLQLFDAGFFMLTILNWVIRLY